MACGSSVDAVERFQPLGDSVDVFRRAGARCRLGRPSAVEDADVVRFAYGRDHIVSQGSSSPSKGSKSTLSRRIGYSVAKWA